MGDSTKGQSETLRGRGRSRLIPRTNPRDILKDAEKVNFKEGPTEAFESKHKALFLKPDPNSLNVLHELSKPSSDWPDDKLEHFLFWVLERYDHLLTIGPAICGGCTPLHMALDENNHAFVQAVLSKPGMASLGAALRLKTAELGNCLHLAIWNQSPEIESFVEQCRLHKEAFVQGDKNGNTPLHYAVGVFQEDDGELYRDVKPISTNNDQSSSEGAIEIVDDHDGKLHQQVIRQSSPLELPLVKLLVQECPDALFQKNNNKNSPYQERVALLRTKLENSRKQRGITPENHVNDDVPLHKGSQVYKDPQREIDSPESEAERAMHLEAELRQLVMKDPILSFIRSYCIPKFSRDEIVKALYHAGEERHIDFNLSALPNPTISIKYLKRLEKHLRFEDTLKYVALPKLRIEGLKRLGDDRLSKYRERSQAKGLTDLVEVFQWLRDNGVRKILRLIVIDNEEVSHTDEAIEQALEGFDVEVWDWKKIDLCSEVISNSTKKVKEISLYSSGNNSVLLGWYSSEGLRNVEKFPHLETVNLYVRIGLENPSRAKKYAHIFAETLRAHTNVHGKPIKVRDYRDDTTSSFASAFKQEMIQFDNPWISCMEEFAHFIQNIPNDEIKPIKFAVIDNGVDADLDILSGKIAAGISFCPHPNSRDLMEAYFVSSDINGHGSMMATMICNMCPKAQLYIARLEERYSARGSRHFAARSAAEAVNWAVDRGVDVISMSWTIETDLDDSTGDMLELKKAIQAAHEKNIVMLCSTADQGSSSKESCYPGKWGTCIRIGAATGTGERCPWVPEADTDFLFPGDNIPFFSGVNGAPKYHSGSSIATAIAAGMAGLLIYLDELVLASMGRVSEESNLKRKSHMHSAFKTMSKAGDRKFPRVESFFGTKFRDMEWIESPDSAVHALWSLMKEIKTRNEYNN